MIQHQPYMHMGNSWRFPVCLVGRQLKPINNLILNKMKNIGILSVLIIVSLISFSCQKVSENVTVSGTIKGLEKLNKKVPSHVYLHHGFIHESIPIQKDGSFQKEIPLSEPVYCSITIGKMQQQVILLKPGENLEVFVDFNKPLEEALSCGGTLGEYANKLIEIEKPLKKKYLYQLYTEDEYIAEIEALKANVLAMVDTLISDADLRRQQIIRVENDIRIKYQNYRKEILSIYKDRVLSDKFKSKIKDLKMDDMEAFNYSMDFRRYVLRDIYDTLYYKYYKHNGECYGKAGISAISKLKNDLIKDHVIVSSRLSMLRSDVRKEAYEFLISNATDPRAKQIVEEAYQQIAPGKKLESFTYKSYDGKMVSLEDFKGKYVYIDIWASWCAPCIRQMPYLDTIEQKYHGRNIEFVSISVDDLRNTDKWREKIENLNLNGIQLISDQRTNSPFLEQFGVKSIPHFLLIGPDGHLVDGYAPRPSNPKLIEVFDGLGL